MARAHQQLLAEHDLVPEGVALEQRDTRLGNAQRNRAVERAFPLHEELQLEPLKEPEEATAIELETDPMAKSYGEKTASVGAAATAASPEMAATVATSSAVERRPPTTSMRSEVVAPSSQRR